VPQRRQLRAGARDAEGDPPWRRYRLPCQFRVERVEVELGEREVPPFQPGTVEKPAPVDLLGNRPGGTQVGAVEKSARVPAGSRSKSATMLSTSAGILSYTGPIVARSMIGRPLDADLVRYVTLDQRGALTISRSRGQAARPPHPSQAS